jgi:CDP-paratose 2-epimerase
MKKNVLITGGAGFIGSNLAVSLLQKKYNVIIFDNLYRYGTVENLNWIKSQFPNVKIIKGDIRNFSDIKNACNNVNILIHLAAQVAVTTSVQNPREDFEINALGTFNVMESARLSNSKPIVVYSSTNKVYGGMENIQIQESNKRYYYKDYKYGISENFNLDFHSPYGCSKGCADQYVRDYSRIYGLKTVVFRQSCIYGPRQFGIEDQGWIAWFIIALTLNKKIKIYGDGKQVRDILYVDDLVNAFCLSIENIENITGNVYNIGGGYKNTISVWMEFGDILQKLFKRKIDVEFQDWRPGDQKVYISDIRKAKKDFGWFPKIKTEEGIIKLFNWVKKNKKLFYKFIK